TPPELKLRDRKGDVAIGRLYEQHLQRFFELPSIADRSQVFFRAVEIADLMFGLSVLEDGTITPAMATEAARAGIAYLESYLPGALPRRRVDAEVGPSAAHPQRNGAPSSRRRRQ